MSESTGLIETASRQREIGRAAGAAPGPTVIVLGGIHGNEPAGVRAARRVLSRLERDAPTVRGEVVFFAGNLRGLGERKRFIHLDLNRQWTPEKVGRLRDPAGVGLAAEDREQRELLEALGTAVGRARGQVHFLDLHTSSAEGPPFVTVGDTLRNRRFAASIPLPLILGLEEQVDGALLEYLNNFGFVTMGVEGGQHDAESSVDHIEAVIWLALVSAGAIRLDDVPELERHSERLERASAGFPRVVEVRRRHAVAAGDGFRMEPGFSNFQPVERGRLLAQSGAGPIHAPETGLLLLPLYQGLGDDGFFVAREVRPFWLRVSALLRRLRLGRLVKLLPGVRRHPDDDEVLIVDTRIARWYPLEVFHLFGFRKLRREGVELIVSRRRYDLAPPPRISLT